MVLAGYRHRLRVYLLVAGFTADQRLVRHLRPYDSDRPLQLVEVHAPTMSMTPEAVLAQMPGWEDAQLTELSGGLTNQTWRVTSLSNKSGVLKIDEGETPGAVQLTT